MFHNSYVMPAPNSIMPCPYVILVKHGMLISE